jgi:hypothetical protein
MILNYNVKIVCRNLVASGSELERFQANRFTFEYRWRISMLKQQRVLCTSLGLIVVCALSTSQTHAAIVFVDGNATISSTSSASDIVVGDNFNWSFSYDDALTDSSVDTNEGDFGSLLSFTLTRDAGNTGAWDPSGGMFTVSPIDELITVADNNELVISVLGTGFPTIDGNAFEGVFIEFSWLSTVHDIVDTGSGQTLRQQFGGLSPDFSNNAGIVFGIDSTFSTSFASASVNAVPEPSSLAMMAIGCVGFALRRRKNNCLMLARS